jgi:AraC-like DNA-binding protein
MTLVLMRENAETEHDSSLLFLTAPGFHPFFPHEEDIETITQIVFSDFLVDLFHFEPLAFIGKFLKDAAGCRLILPNAFANQVKELIAGLGKSQGLESFGQLLQLMNLLGAEGEKLALKDELQMPAGISQATLKINKVKHFVKENFRRSLRISEVAELIGLSESRFSCFFKQTAGVYFNDYVSLVRVEEATRLLRKTDDTVSGIAYSCGFNNPQNFGRVFKRLKGASPGKTRKESC